MDSIRRAVPPVLLSCLLLAGCSNVSSSGSDTSGKDGASAAGSSGTAVPAGAAKIAVGAGPQTTYTVQQQPPAGSCKYRYEKGEPLEDRSCTPGAISSAVTQANLASTICRKGGYTKGIRPPASVTGKEKRLNAASYGYTGSMSDAEYDHLISLQLGGDPNDPRNLWVEDYRGSFNAHDKDRLEGYLHEAVCSGKMSLRAAQEAIATNWVKAYCDAKLRECPDGTH